jgi:hypothetical protein
MKKVVLLLILFTLTATFMYASIALVHWQNYYGGSGIDSVRSAYLLKNGAVLLSGFSDSTELFKQKPRSTDVLEMIISAEGKQLLSGNFGGMGEDRGYSAIETSDNAFVIAGSSASTEGDRGNSFGLWDGWVIKTDKTFNILWEKAYGGKDNDSIREIIEAKDGGYVFCGYTQSSNLKNHKGGKDFWIVKLDTEGQVVWEKVYGGSRFDMAYSIAQTSDYGFIVVGYTFSFDGDLKGKNNFGNGDWWILKINRYGDIEWSEVYGGSGWDEPRKVCVTSDKGFIITGVTGSHDGNITGNRGGWDVWLLKLNRSGKIEWSKTFGGSKHDKAFALAIDRRGNYFLAGYTTSSDGDISEHFGEMDAWILRVSKTGSLMWEHTFGTSKNECAEAIVQLQDGTYLFAGGTFEGEPEVAGDDGRMYDAFWVVNFQP